MQHWSEAVPKHQGDDGARLTVWAGEFQGKRGLKPPANSYASQAGSDVAVFFLELPPGAALTVPAASGGAAVNRMLYFVEGARVSVGDQSVQSGVAITLDPTVPLRIENTHASATAELLMLQGRPIGEPVAQQGPFVMNTAAEIRRAYADYQETRFGGWPWPRDAMTFPREKGRFALKDGKEERPPTEPSEVE